MFTSAAPDPSLRLENGDIAGDAAQGEMVFTAAGCASCHGSDEGDLAVLGGGQAFETPFGVFYAPNVSMDKAVGIGGWTINDFARALREGVSPQGEHYFPAFPYAAYRGMSDQDVRNLWAYWQELPSVDTASKPHALDWPYSVRRNVGVWKRMALPYEYPASEEMRGAYLVEVLGHCGECHTPRDKMGVLDMTAWLKGAPNPSGKGRIPSIHPSALGWSVEEIVDYLETGFTPDFDVAGGHMAKVIENTARLSQDERAAIARYLVTLP